MTRFHFRAVETMPYSDDREPMYAQRQYVLTGSEGWVDVRNMSVHLVKERDGVYIEVWPIETEGLSAERPLGRMKVKEPEQARGPTPRKRIINTVQKVKRE